MNFTKYLTVVCAGLVLFGATACSSLLDPPQIIKPVDYDWGFPSTVFPDVKRMVVINQFRMDGVSRSKMTFRTGSNTIVTDDRNHWVMAPSMLLTNYLNLAFEKASGSYDSRVIIDGTIMMCQVDIEKKEAILIVLSKMRDFKKATETKSYVDTFRIPIKKVSPNAFAEAMGIAAGQFAEKVRTRL